MDDDLSQDICRVCRCEATTERPLFYPCICTGSIKYIHQDCLLQWMRYSHKQYCELCGHRFRFQPIYSPDMPRVLPLRDVIGGLLSAVVQAAKSWFHYTLVGVAWFGIVPLSAYRTYRYLFRAPSFDTLLSWHGFEDFSTENLTIDAFRGCFVVTCTLFSFIGLVWLREQILHGGGPDWLERDDIPPLAVAANPAQAVAEGEADAAPPIANEINQQLEQQQQQQQLAAAANDVQINNEHNDDIPIDMPINNAAPPAIPAEGEGEGEEGEGEEGAAGVGGGEPRWVFRQDARGAGVAADLHAAFRAVAADIDNDNEEPNWNPMEWDRAAEEITWERLLGLDGSLVFLEHVFWIISLNTMFIFTFAFCPYCIGNFVLNLLDMLQPEKPIYHFHGLLTTLFGYCCIGMTLVILHAFARIFRLRRIRWIIGFCYIVVKVSLLSVVEIGVLPLICGWWLDICSLPLFDASLKDRKTSFRAAPGTSLFVHWMFGMVYVYYFTAFISLLREVLRPGVLWFLRNLNDPDFSPIQEMIHLTIFRHIRRIIASIIIFGSAVMLMLWLPISILKWIWPAFLPYTLSGDSEVNELSLQLLLLQIILPGFFELSHTRIWLKGLVRAWCIAVSWLLGIHSYLLGTEQQEQAGAEGAPVPPAEAEVDPDQEQQPPLDEHIEDREKQDENDENEPLIADELPLPEQQKQEEEAEPEEIDAAAVDEVPYRAQPPPPPPPPAGNLAGGQGHHGLPQRDVPAGFQPYVRPQLFTLRLCILLVLVGISLIMGSLVVLTVPVWIGRQVLALWSVGGLSTQVVTSQRVGLPEITPRPHELYTAALGTYLCWILSRAIAIAVSLVPLGRAAIMDKIKQWLRVAASYAMPVLIFVCMLSIIPLLFGLLLELVLVIPLRVPLNQTPVHFLWQDWALGVLYTKIAIALTLMGPDWQMKRAIERAYRDGLRDIDMKFLIKELAAPCVVSLGIALAVPYILAHCLMPCFIEDAALLLTISRIIYPTCFVVLVIIAYVYFEIHQFKKLYVAIKVDKYLVGQRLVNYVDNKRRKEAEAALAASIAAADALAVAAVAHDVATGTGNNIMPRDVAFENIKEPVQVIEPIINPVESEMLELLRRESPNLYYRQQPQPLQVEDNDIDEGFGNELL